MKLFDTASLTGRLHLRVYRLINEEKILIGEYVDSNLITISGLQLITFLLSGEPGNNKVIKVGVGDGTNPTHESDVGLTNAYIKNIDSYTFDADNIINYKISVDTGDGNGLNISEFGLFSGDEQLFSRKIQNPAIPKDSDIIIEGNWSVSIFQCKENNFSFAPSIRYILVSEIEAPNLERYEPASQADIVSDITSDIGKSNLITSQGDIVSDITSDADAEREFASTAGITSDAVSDIGKSNLITSQGDIVSDISSDANAERELAAQADIDLDITSDADAEREIASQADIVFDINDPAIETSIVFASQADIVSDITSDADTERELAAQADIVSDISSDIDITAPEVWTSYFDNTKWTALTGSWSGSDWDSADLGPGGHVIILQDAGAWTSSYRPTKIRFTSSVSPLQQLILKDSNGDTIASQASPAENTGYTITFGSFDIDELTIIRAFGTGSWTLTDIEFLEP